MLYFFISFVAICAPQVESSFTYGAETARRMLIDGNWIPMNAYGTRVRYDDIKRVQQTTTYAMEVGYRTIDTGPGYLTEDVVGNAIVNVTGRGIVRRTDLFICTKLPFTVGSREQVAPAIRDSLKRLQTNYVDLVLLETTHNVLDKGKHNISDIWRGLEDAKWAGLTRSIGVANFDITDISKILASSKTIPAVNQIETNPTFANLKLVAYCQSKSIVVMGCAAFGFLVRRPHNNITLPPTFTNPVLVKMAKKYGVTVSQVVLRSLLDRNIVPVSTSSNKEHIKLNEDIFDFHLSHKEIQEIKKFDKNEKVHPIEVDDMRKQYEEMKSYIKKNNLTQYENI